MKKHQLNLISKFLFFLTSRWTARENDQLRAAVQEHGERHWTAVAAHLEGRTTSQCMNRWHKSLHPTIHRGRWTSEEDTALLRAVQVLGTRNWAIVREQVQGRTDVQCRERWHNVLDPGLGRGIWTSEEDSRLRDAIQLHGSGHWSAVAACVRTRTDNQCWRRYKQLYMKSNEESSRKRRHLKKVP